MKRAFTTITENLVNSFKVDISYDEMFSDLIEKIKETLDNEQLNLVVGLMQSYIDDMDNTTIIGLVNDSDVFDFYITHRNSLDELLTKIEFFNLSPVDAGSLPSVYSYVITATKMGIKELFVMATESKTEA